MRDYYSKSSFHLKYLRYYIFILVALKFSSIWVLRFFPKFEFRVLQSEPWGEIINNIHPLSGACVLRSSVLYVEAEYISAFS